MRNSRWWLTALFFVGMGTSPARADGIDKGVDGPAPTGSLRESPQRQWLHVDVNAEKRFGAAYDQVYMRKTYPDLHEAAPDSRMRRIADRLVAVADPDHRYSWTFQIAGRMSPPIAATCAGYVYAKEGLLDSSEFSDDEIAGIMAHEIAHVMLHHVAWSYVAEYPRYLVESKGGFDDRIADLAIADVKSGKWFPLGMGPFNVIQFARLAAYREIETEADIRGVHYAAAAGFKADAHADALLKLQPPAPPINPLDPKTWRRKLMATHPDVEERVKRIRDEAAKIQRQ